MLSPLLLILFFIVHDGEEVLYLPAWVHKNKAVFDQVEVRVPRLHGMLSLLQGSTQRQFTLSAGLLLVIISIISVLAMLYPTNLMIQYVFLGGLIIYTLHLVVHFGQSLYLRKIIPGTLSSLIILIPCILLWFERMEVTGISFQSSLLAGLGGAVILLPLFPSVLKFGRFVGKDS